MNKNSAEKLLDLIKCHEGSLGPEITLNCIKKGLKEVINHVPIPKGSIPPAGNTCGIHMAFFHALVDEDE